MSSVSPDGRAAAAFDPSICRDYLRNVCKRGGRCKFKHPSQEDCEKIRRSERIFCHDFQNSTCRRPACKFLHYSREDEEIFRLTGYLPNESEHPGEGARFQPVEEKPPICKDHLNGVCTRGSSCKYRHVSVASEKRALKNQYESSSSKWNNSFTDQSRSAADVGPITGALQPSSTPASLHPILTNPMGLNCSNSVQCSAVLTVPTSVSPVERLQLPPSSLLGQSGIVSGPDTLLTSMSDAFVSTSTQPAPIVGVVDHASFMPTNLQHTVYAHSSNMGTFTPLVSVSSAPQSAPCSSMLAVVAEPSQNPSVMQHPAAVASSHATYHLLPNNSASIHHHLLPSNATPSSAQTLLTIPLTQFTCNVSSSGPVLRPQAAIACTTHQHPTVLTSVLPANSTLTNTSVACYPSYNVLQINHSPVVENTLPVMSVSNSLQRDLREAASSTTTVSSSTTAVLAAAAAAGYLAQHLPVMTDTNVGSGGTSASRFATEHEPINGSHGSAAIAAAANLPAVSAAAAAAVAAATAFAARSVPVCHKQLAPENPLLEASTSERSSSEDLRCSQQLAVRPRSYTDGSHCIGLVDEKTMNAVSITHAAAPLQSTAPPCHMSSSSRYLNQNQQAEENAKTAAAVAAAACIGAMFSQPMTSGNSNPSSVAAMLGDLMGQNQLGLTQPPTSTNSTETSDAVQRIHSFTEVAGSPAVTPERIGGSSDGSEQRPADADSSVDSSRTCRNNNFAKSSGACKFDDRSLSSNIPPGSHSCFELSSDSLGQPQTHLHTTFPAPSEWSNVATTVASAAKAAAAAAVAATAAVTGSAKFFQLAHKQNPPTGAAALSSSSAKQPVKSDPTGPPTPSQPHSSAALTGVNQTPVSSSVSLPTLGPASRSGFSPDTAATMTSAAAAAAMVAAAASAAAKQRRFLSEIKLPAFSVSTERNFDNQARKKLKSHDMYDAEDPEYNVSPDADHYLQSKRRVKQARKQYNNYSRFRNNTNLRGETLDEDEDEEDGFEEDDTESTVSIPLSPEITPPYRLPSKMNKHQERINIDYSHPIGDSRPPSCETSPSDTLYDMDAYIRASCQHAFRSPAHRPDRESTRIEQPIKISECVVSTVKDAMETRSGSQLLPRCSSLNSDHYRHTIPMSALDLPNAVSDNGRSDVYAQSLRKACSTGSLCPPLGIRLSAMRCRSASLPSLKLMDGHNSYADDRHELGASLSGVMSGTSVSSASGVDEPPSHVRGLTRSVIPGMSGSSSRRNQNTTFFLSRKKQQSVLSHNSYRLYRYRARVCHGKMSKHFESLPSETKQVLLLASKNRSKASASPDSVLTEDYSGHDDIDEPEFIDTEYYDDDIYEVGSSQPSRKRPRSSGVPRLRLTKQKCNALCSSGTFTNMNYRSASMRQQNALKAENARLRRKLSDLMRQRGDLRAANEILLEQNARLRHSSKRVSAVARMAESATKIIEAHSKSQLVPPATQTGSYQSQSAPMPQATNPFSLHQAAAAAAVAAAAQHQPNVAALGGVYVSSPTASAQQVPQGVPALGGTHSFFPSSAVVANAVPVALPSQQSLTTVQIQTPNNSILPTSISAASTLLQQAQPVHPQQANISHFYSHQLTRSIGTLPVSIGNMVTRTSLVPASSAIQVCHYPVPSSGTVFPSVPQATAVTPLGTNALTLVLGQPPTAYAPVGSQVPTALHLSGGLETDSTSVNVTPAPQISYAYQCPAPILAPSVASGLSTSSSSTLDGTVISTAATAADGGCTLSALASPHDQSASRTQVLAMCQIRAPSQRALARQEN
ncbi:unnamed protein product [Calicophoron daubneyi]|uniref:C3H1-type domain-containing protein n=1 Tax=Calicophoron daubneyi TaxID=300641 RepID=A0AAV2TGY8_CALDB